MKHNDLKGMYSALMTAFDEQGNINEQGVREMVRHNIDVMGMDGLYICGSTGENFLISTEEKKRIFSIVKDEAQDKVKLIAQVGSLNVMESAELAKFTTDLGYDAISAVTPFYYKFSFEEIKEYYNTIIRDVDNRLIVYSIPVLSGVNMTAAQFAELFENEKIAGVKFTASDFYLLERLRHAFPDHLIFSGFDEMLLSAAALGVDGAIGSTYNVNGKKAKMIYKAVQNGDLKSAQAYQKEYNDMVDAILKNGLYPTLKALLELSGVHAGYCRKPMLSATEAQKAGAKKIFDAFIK